jgi:hypothetical protein
MCRPYSQAWLIPEVSMRIVPNSQKLRSRIAQVVALGGVITTASCKDVAAPEKSLEAPAVTLSQSAAVGDELGGLSSSLDDMTGWSLASLPEGEGRVKIVGILNGLRGHLKSGRIAAVQQDVADARAFLESLGEQERVELGAVGVTLDAIQSALDKASQ